MRKLLVIGLTALIAGLMVFIAGCGSGESSTEVLPSPPGPAVKLVFRIQPVGAVARSDFEVQPVVAVEDAEGNIVTGYRGVVVLTATAGTGVSVPHLFGGTKVLVKNGMVEFKHLSVDKAGVGHTLTATSGTLAPATSIPFTILPGPAEQLAFTTQPSRSIAGSPLTVQPAVTVQDRYGNTVTGYEGSVRLLATITYESETWRGVTSGTTTVPVVNGVAQFTDISIDLTHPGYKLTAMSDSLSSAFSKSFAISPAAPAKLEFTVQPEEALAGAPFKTQPKVAIEDICGNVVTSSRATVTLSIAPGAGTAGAILSGTKTLIAEGGFLGGLAVFTDLSIDRAGSGYMLTATSSGLTSAISQAFDVSAP